MYLHNKIEITFHDREKESEYIGFNTMLSSLLPEIASFQKWNEYFVFGVGDSATQDSQTTLDAFVMSEKSDLVFSQFNPAKGTCFAKKQVLFDSTNPNEFEFCEVGISKESAYNPDCMSRFLMTDESGQVLNIKRNAFERMTVSVTVYLKVDENSSAKLTAGENLLVKALLGVENILFTENNFKIATGQNLTPNSEVINRDDIIGSGEVSLMTTNIENGKLKLNFEYHAGLGEFIEFVFLINDLPVLRFNAAENNKVEYEDSSNADLLGWLYLSKPNIVKLFNLYDSNTGTFHLQFKLESFGLSFAYSGGNPFDYNYPNLDNCIVSSKANRIAFFYADRIDIYKVEGKNFVRLNSSNIVLPQGFVRMVMYDDFLVILSTYNKASQLTYYYCENNVYVKKIINASFHFSRVGVKRYWEEMDFTVLRGNQILRMGYVEESGVSRFGYVDFQIDENFNLNSIRTVISTDLNYENLFAVPPNETYDGTTIQIKFNSYFSTANLRYSVNDSSAINSNSNFSYRFLRDVSLPILGAGRGFFVYNENKTAISIGDLESQVSYTYHLEGARKMCIGRTLKYLARIFNNRVEFYLIKKNNELIVFKENMPLNVLTNQIVDILILDSMAIIFTTDPQQPIYTVHISENHNMVNVGKENKNHNVTANYDYLKPIGFDGEDVVVKFGIEIDQNKGEI